jgi:hypothetical protein
MRPEKTSAERDAHIYSKLNGSKVVANIDRRWLLTSSAFSQFRPSRGRINFAGLGFVNYFDQQTKIMSITPYVIGMPTNLFMEAFSGSD